jgi:predicted RNase H-like HicB family nuclease
MPPGSPERSGGTDRYGREGIRFRRPLVICEQAEHGTWGAHSPDVDGVFALGATREETETRMAEALSAHVAYLRERGRLVPEPIGTLVASRA